MKQTLQRQARQVPPVPTRQYSPKGLDRESRTSLETRPRCFRILIELCRTWNVLQEATHSKSADGPMLKMLCSNNSVKSAWLQPRMTGPNTLSAASWQADPDMSSKYGGEYAARVRSSSRRSPSASTARLIKSLGMLGDDVSRGGLRSCRVECGRKNPTILRSPTGHRF